MAQGKEGSVDGGRIRMGNSRGTWMGNEVGRRVRAGRRIGEDEVDWSGRRDEVLGYDVQPSCFGDEV